MKITQTHFKALFASLERKGGKDLKKKRKKQVEEIEGNGRGGFGG